MSTSVTPLPESEISRTTARSNRWLILATTVMAVSSACAFQNGMGYLLPMLRGGGVTLGVASVLAAMPTAGMLATLIAWGAVTDRWGERLVLATGLATSGALLLLTSLTRGPWLLGIGLFLAGAAGASVHASSGRLILGWFDAGERGFAMGVRQSAQPLGVAIAGLALPNLAAQGRAVALLFLGGCALLAATLVAAVVRDPARAKSVIEDRPGSPYRASFLWRIHSASALLIIPQFAVATFALVFLVDMCGWRASTAGIVLAVAQIGGASGRLAAGRWSDRTGSRVQPVRRLCVAMAAAVAALAVAATTHSALAVAALLVAGVATTSSNGLTFAAVAEYAGPAWAGRALGIQNTVQNAVAAGTPPMVAMVIDSHGYGTAYTAIAVLPLFAAALIPRRDETVNPL